MGIRIDPSIIAISFCVSNCKMPGERYIFTRVYWDNMTWGYCDICGKTLEAGKCKNDNCKSLQGVVIPPNIDEMNDSIFQYGVRFTVEKGTFDIMNERAIDEKMRLVIANHSGSPNYEYLKKLGPPMSVKRAKRLIEILSGLMARQTQTSRVFEERLRWTKYIRENYIE